MQPAVSLGFGSLWCGSKNEQQSCAKMKMSSRAMRRMLLLVVLQSFSNSE